MITDFESIDHQVKLVCPAYSKRALGFSLGMTGATAKKVDPSFDRRKTRRTRVCNPTGNQILVCIQRAYGIPR
jgi:hypothetical protein